MDQGEKEKDAVWDDGSVESCKKEKMKRSLLESCKAEAESMADDEATEVENPSETLRECNICGKTFKSGKALGGHRRSHFQKKVKVRFTNNSSKTGDHSNNNKVNNYDDYGKRICCICKKEFPTKNALFGHMRSHPERSWRGISPPTHSHKNSSSSLSYSYSKSYDSMGTYMDDYDDDDCVGGDNRVIAPDDEHHTTDIIDLSSFTSPSWVKTDTRGRKCIGAIEAAQTLFFFGAYLRYIVSGESNGVSPKKDEVPPKSATPLIKLGKRKIIGESLSSKKHEGKKNKFCLKGELKIGKKNDGVGECVDDEGHKLHRSKGLSGSGVEIISHVDEGFAFVNTELVTADTVEDDESNVNVDQKGKNGQRLVLKSKVKEEKDTKYENEAQEKVAGYKCGACEKVFTTFQGLGGHRSVHKEKNIVARVDSNYSEAVAEENNSSSSSNMQKMDEATMNNEATLPCHQKLDFDLNELPCIMDY